MDVDDRYSNGRKENKFPQNDTEIRVNTMPREGVSLLNTTHVPHPYPLRHAALNHKLKAGIHEAGQHKACM